MTTPVPPRTVPPAKITGYLLKPDHPIGGPKSVFFRSFGFSLDQSDVMAVALIAHADRNPVIDTPTDQWGMKYIVRCHVQTPDGRNPCIITVWIVPRGETEARLVTAYPAD
ncbi:DUF6883 domain-containing protein [Methylobacterium sp. yr668]|uniref:DUF6883 domain-containing protein n=1 Tax=Methylobacterium sp. yr668 TaxID=1761801 RepID=UPI000B899869